MNVTEDTGTISQTIKTNHSVASWALVTSLVLLLAMSPRAFATNVVAVPDFGSNPGNLSMFKYVPDQLPPSAPLVVVMHGCTQHAAAFAKESGWTQLADGLRFALVLPETDKPLANGCFTWYQTSDATRDQGRRRRDDPRSCSLPTQTFSPAALSSPASLMDAQKL
jgi:poly(3-hydroxybutyrate) depolymerase